MKKNDDAVYQFVRIAVMFALMPEVVFELWQLMPLRDAIEVRWSACAQIVDLGWDRPRAGRTR
jgi:hypothetical protein